MVQYFDHELPGPVGAGINHDQLGLAHIKNRFGVHESDLAGNLPHEAYFMWDDNHGASRLSQETDGIQNLVTQLRVQGLLPLVPLFQNSNLAVLTIGYYPAFQATSGE